MAWQLYFSKAARKDAVKLLRSHLRTKAGVKQRAKQRAEAAKAHADAQQLAGDRKLEVPPAIAAARSSPARRRLALSLMARYSSGAVRRSSGDR